jgi:hypothetical protein
MNQGHAEGQRCWDLFFLFEIVLPELEFENGSGKSPAYLRIGTPVKTPGRKDFFESPFSCSPSSMDEEWNAVTPGRRIRDHWQQYRKAVVGVFALFMLVVLMTVTRQPGATNLGTRNWLTSMWKVRHEERAKHGDEKQIQGVAALHHREHLGAERKAELNRKSYEDRPGA